MKSVLAASLLLPAALAKGTLKSEPVTGGLCDATVKSSSGYYHVETGVDKNYFYWMFESRDTPASGRLLYMCLILYMSKAGSNRSLPIYRPSHHVAERWPRLFFSAGLADGGAYTRHVS